MNSNRIFNNMGSGEEWEETIAAINKYLTEILFKIEWKYGDCRAPFVFPPRFEVGEQSGNAKLYKCIVKLEFTNDEWLVFQAGDPSTLFKNLVNDFRKRFSFAE